MRLTKLYSNRSQEFPAITFNRNVNVILGHVENRDHNKDDDSHNLWKSTLMRLISFMLWDSLSSSANADHFLHKECFEGFVFFLVIENNEWGYFTIMRAANEPTKISVVAHEDSDIDMTDYIDEKDEWDEYRMGFKPWKSKINELLNLDLWWSKYRDGLPYYLRRSDKDYWDMFRIETRHFKHKQWKPYVARMLGFDWKLIEQKYWLDDRIKEVKNKLSNENGSRDNLSLEELEAALQSKQENLATLRTGLKEFDFYDSDRIIDQEVVSGIQRDVWVLNEWLLDTKSEIADIQDLLSSTISFNLERMNSVFHQVWLIFPEEIQKDYEELYEFNLKITEDRNKHLEERLKYLQQKEVDMEDKLKSLSDKLKVKVEYLWDKDFFIKYKWLQTQILKKELEVDAVVESKNLLLRRKDIETELDDLQKEYLELVSKIKESISESTFYKDVNSTYRDLSQKIINKSATIKTGLNNNNNITFDSSILSWGWWFSSTSEWDGSTYKKLLIALFDITMVLTHINTSFFRFIYHDAIFDGMDSNRKAKFFSEIKRLSEEHDFQYIFTIIETDTNFDVDGYFQFEDKDILLELYEWRDNWRLFKMPRF